MKRTVIVFVVLALLAICVAAAYAEGKVVCKDNVCTIEEHEAQAKVQSAVCPVMGNPIPDIAKAAGKSVYKGKTYYFCCNSCKPQFDKNPAKYIKPVAKPQKVVSAVCPVMGSKIPDVTKAAGKSVYKGKTYYFCCGGCKPQFDKNPEKYIKPAK